MQSTLRTFELPHTVATVKLSRIIAMYSKLEKWHHNSNKRSVE
jgi:hypothetical protein